MDRETDRKTEERTRARTAPEAERRTHCALGQTMKRTERQSLRLANMRRHSTDHLTDLISRPTCAHTQRLLQIVTPPSSVVNHKHTAERSSLFIVMSCSIIRYDTNTIQRLYSKTDRTCQFSLAHMVRNSLSSLTPLSQLGYWLLNERCYLLLHHSSPLEVKL